MADEIANSTPGVAASTAPAPAAEAVASPTPAAAPITNTETPAPAPAAPTPEAPAVVEPVVAPAAEPVAPDAEPEAPKTDSTLLGKDALKKSEPEVKPAEGEVKPGETKEADGSQSDEPAPLPTYEEFEIPEGISYDNERLGDFTKMLGEFETTTKASHEEVQKFGQNLVNQHIAEVKSALERQHESYVSAWQKQSNDWLEAFRSDTEIGGNRQDTTVSSALEFIRTHGGTEAQQEEFHSLMDSTKVGNHPAMLRLLANAMNAKKEGGPLAATKPLPEARSKIAKRYGSST